MAVRLLPGLHRLLAAAANAAGAHLPANGIFLCVDVPRCAYVCTVAQAAEFFAKVA
jgi:hypothetical protein